jgi:hypothetical protein
MPVPSRSKRLASGRARAIGEPTRGTTAPNRLRRVDRWLLHALGPRLSQSSAPLVVDLGFGSSPITGAWAQLCATGASVIDGTCDEIGRRGCWLLIEDGRPVSLTLSAHLASLRRPSELAERLPKALIARNVAGEPVHSLLAALDARWAAAAPLSPFGPRQRWEAAAAGLLADGWPVIGRRARWRLGELTVRWPPDA